MALVLSTVENRVATVFLNRTEKLNALNREMLEELGGALRSLGSSPEVKTIVITGGDTVFCAGADLEEAAAATDASAGYAFSTQYQRLCDLVEKLPQPVIAAVSGYALGAGFELAMACDFCIASDTAIFGLPEINIGAFPAGGGTQRLVRLVGPARAKELIFTGRQLKAKEALSLGLVQAVYPVGEYLGEALRLAQEIAGKPRLALEAAKKLINQSIFSDLEKGLELEARSFAAVVTSLDFREGTAAFAARRTPIFQDR